MDFSAALDLAILDAVEAAIGTAPSLVLYSGSKPTACTDADPAGPLVTYSLPSNWMADAAAGQKTIGGLWSAPVTGNGTALSFRLKQGATTHVQGTVSGPAGSGDMKLENPTLAIGQTLTIEQWTLFYTSASSAVASATLGGVVGTAVVTVSGSTPPPPSGLPVWVPNVGQLATISLNTLSSTGIYPGPVGSGYNAYATKVTAWNSGAFAPDFSTFGGYIVVGGGDADWHGNEVCVFDLNTRMWVRINDPSTNVSDADYTAGNLTYGEWPDGKPGMPHTYGAIGYLPPSLGGGSKGSLLLIWKSYWHRSYGNSGHAHKCDLSTGVWSRASSIPGAVNVSTWSYDSRRKRFVGTYTGPSPATGKVYTFGNFLSGVGAHSTEGPDHHSLGATCSSEYVPTLDALIQIGTNTSFVMEMRGYDLLAGSGTRYTLKVIGDPLPAGAGHGMAWVPDVGSLYISSTVPGQQQYIWKVTPPVGDWRTANWTCQRILMSGHTIAEPPSENGIWQRLRYAPAIKSLIWVQSVSGPVYCYRVAAATPALTLTTTTVPVVTTSGAQNIVSPASKHLQFVEAGGRWYKVVGDHKQDDPESFTDYGGRQEIYSFVPTGNSATDDWRRDQRFYIPDPQQIQIWAPDDAFAIHRNGEIWVFVSVRNLETPPNPLPRAIGPKATQINNAIMAWTVPSGPWRIVRYHNGSTALGEEWRSGNAWRALYDDVTDKVFIPLQQNGLKVHITDCVTGLDASTRNPTTGALQGYGDRWLGQWTKDPMTRYVYSVDWMHGQIWRVNLDNLNDRTYLLTCPDEVNTSGSWFLKQTRQVFIPHLRAFVAGGNWWNVYEVDTGRFTQYPRTDGFWSQTGKWIPTSDVFYDAPTQTIISIGGIDWDGGSAPARYYRTTLTLGPAPNPYAMVETQVNATYFNEGQSQPWVAGTGNGCDWRDRNGNFRGEIPLTGDTSLVTSTAWAYMPPPASTVTLGAPLVETTCTLTSLVTDWRANGNRGLILRGGTGWAMASRNHSDSTKRPYLDVIIGGQTYRCDCTADAEWNSVTPATGYGDRDYNEQTTTSNESKKIVMQFDISTLPAGTVTSATLHVWWMSVNNNSTGLWIYQLWPPL